MDKRSFIKYSGMATAGAIIAPTLTFCTNEPNAQEIKDKPAATTFELPKLPYGYDALEPHIDARTMEIHHTKHHAGYTTKLNTALEGNGAFSGKSIEEILAGLTEDESQTAIRNNGGGFYNHSLFWEVMHPSGGGLPDGTIGEAINANFGSFDAFKTAFSKEAGTVFGSGWAWLCVDGNKKLQICSTPNQDNPLMTKIAEKPGMPVLGIDVWEHAYYLKHQNKRPEYIDSFFNVINWENVARRYANAVS
jgi:Fe-Mn family superoxide dismutase